MIDAERRGLTANILFLAGSAINSVKNAAGRPDPQLGAESMLEALEVHRSGELVGASVDDHLPAPVAVAPQEHGGAVGGFAATLSESHAMNRTRRSSLPR